MSMLYFIPFHHCHLPMHPIFGENSIPRYIQLADLFRQRIARGIWPLGQNLPSIDELGREFDVARATIRQAVDCLAREGLLSPQQGRGTVVTGKAAPDRWLTVQTTLNDLHEVYLDTKPQLTQLGESTAMPILTEKDGKPAAKYRHMRRLHARDDVPYCVISLYLDERIFSRAPDRFRNEIVISVLRTMRGVKVAKARQTLTIGSADVEVASLLKVPINSPVTEVRRVFNSSDGTVIYIAEVTYRGDFIRVEVDLHV